MDGDRHERVHLRAIDSINLISDLIPSTIKGTKE